MSTKIHSFKDNIVILQGEKNLLIFSSYLAHSLIFIYEKQISKTKEFWYFFKTANWLSY